MPNELKLKNIEMQRTYEYSLNTINPDYGTVTVKVNDEIRNVADGCAGWE